MMKEIIQQNFMAVTIIIFLMLFILLNNNFDKKTNRLFLCSAVCVLLFIVEEAWEGQLARRDTYSYMRVVLSAAGYTLRPMTAYFLVMINGKKKLEVDLAYEHSCGAEYAGGVFCSVWQLVIRIYPVE